MTTESCRVGTALLCPPYMHQVNNKRWARKECPHLTLLEVPGEDKNFFIVFIMLFTSYAVAAPTVEIKPSGQRTSRSAFSEDHLDLILLEDGKIRDTHYFYSSYGKAEAKLVRDAKGTFYVLLRHGEGQGTHVRQEYITVFKVIRKLNELATFPLNGPAGMSSDWAYKYILNHCCPVKN